MIPGSVSSSRAHLLGRGTNIYVCFPSVLGSTQSGCPGRAHAALSWCRDLLRRSPSSPPGRIRTSPGTRLSWLTGSHTLIISPISRSWALMFSSPCYTCDQIPGRLSVCPAGDGLPVGGCLVRGRPLAQAALPAWCRLPCLRPDDRDDLPGRVGNRDTAGHADSLVWLRLVSSSSWTGALPWRGPWQGSVS